MTNLFEAFGVQQNPNMVKTQYVDRPPDEPLKAPSLLPILREEVDIANVIVHHRTYVLEPSRAFGMKITFSVSAGITVFGMYARGMHIIDAGMGGVLIGIFAGFGAAAIYQMNLNDSWLSIFNYSSNYTRKFAKPRKQEKNLLAFNVAGGNVVGETGRPVVNNIAPASTATIDGISFGEGPVRETNRKKKEDESTRFSRVEYHPLELQTLASVCMIGDKLTRDPLYDFAPQALKDTPDWKNFNKNRWPDLRKDLEHLRLLDKKGCWTPTAVKWFEDQGFRVGIYTIDSKKVRKQKDALA